jgi:hypothetical protein
MASAPEVIEHLEARRGSGGSPAYVAAWERALHVVDGLLEPIREKERFSNRAEVEEAMILVDGGMALAVAFYTIARENGIAVSEVSRQPLEHLVHWEQVQAMRNEQQWSDLITSGRLVPERRIMDDWERRLAALGHTMTEPADPIAPVWHHLRKDYGPPDPNSPMWEDSTIIVGIAGYLGMKRILHEWPAT